METIWTILELEPTKDVAAIRQAYARKAKDCHPEEDQEGFLRLRQAYQAAMDYAERSVEAPPERTPNEAEDNGWSIPDDLPEAGPNPFRDGEAIQGFMDRYTGKQRKNPKLWMDYFTSSAFLDAAWDSRFTALLLEKVTEVEQELPPSREFLLWLSIVYRYSITERLVLNREEMKVDNLGRNVQLGEGADFDGMESILRIAAKGPVPKRPKNNEFAILNSFMDYHHLVGLAESGRWDEQAIEEFKWIAGRYSSAYIKERCEQRVAPVCERHPAGLRVFIHFFRRRDLPEELYRIAWEKFDLKSAIMGRGKALYGPLREIAMERVPGIDGEKRENFFRLNQDRDACYARIKAHPERAEEELDALFAQENMQEALRNRRFIDEQLVYYFNWMNQMAPEGMVRRLADFYRSHPELPGWDRVVQQAESQLEERDVIRQRQEERQRLEEEAPKELDMAQLLEMLTQVIIKPFVGPERVFALYQPPEYDEWEDEEPPEHEELPEQPAALVEGNDLSKPLTEEDLSALLDQYARGELERLELRFSQKLLALVRDGDKYGCFCFEAGYDTWYSLLSQPEVYTTVNCKDVVYEPFGMGMMAAYNIHDSAGTVMEKLPLALMQMGQGRVQVRVGDCWLWSQHTDRWNSQFKKRMAMQKFAKIPASRTCDYILSKFVISQRPVRIESVTLAGERTLTDLRPGSYGLASTALVQFFQKKLSKLRLSWEFKNPEGGAYRRHMVLLQDGGQFMMAWLQDSKEQAGFYAIDAPRMFLGRLYPACLVHLDLGRIRNCVDLILDDVPHAGLVTDRPGEFVLEDRPYAQVRAELVNDQA